MSDVVIDCPVCQRFCKDPHDQDNVCGFCNDTNHGTFEISQNNLPQFLEEAKEYIMNIKSNLVYVNTADGIFEEEKDIILNQVDKAISRILLSEDRILKHDPWTWLDEPTETHLLKAARHIMTHLNIQAGGQEPSNENHLDNAITRLSMAIAQLAGAQKDG
jgi:hypothetical protein